MTQSFGPNWCQVLPESIILYRTLISNSFYSHIFIHTMHSNVLTAASNSTRCTAVYSYKQYSKHRILYPHIVLSLSLNFSLSRFSASSLEYSHKAIERNCPRKRVWHLALLQILNRCSTKPSAAFTPTTKKYLCPLVRQQTKCLVLTEMRMWIDVFFSVPVQFKINFAHLSTNLICPWLSFCVRVQRNFIAKTNASQ